jgi:hypothetical protein
MITKVQRLQVLITETIIIIHGQKNKRNRRLSSIVGVNTNPYGRDYEVEELIESKKMDTTKQNTRKVSLDYFQYDCCTPYPLVRESAVRGTSYDNAQDTPFQDSARKYSASGNYFNYNSAQLNGDKSINQNPFYRSGME